MEAKVIIKLIEVNQNPFSEVKDGMTLAHNHFKLEYEGEFEGQAIVHELWITSPNSSASVYGIERFSGKVKGKQGTFVTEHKGKFQNDRIEKNIVIVPGSGTGELKGITGKTYLKSGPSKEFPVLYEFEL